MKKLEIFPYNKKFVEIFEKEKEKISKVLNNCEIHHVGSTAVPGLGGKGIIDIMIALENWKAEREVIKKLKNTGFKHVHPREQGRLFLSKHRKPIPDNVHIHIVIKGSKLYKELLAYRDYLRINKKEAKKYFDLKLKWLEKARGNRAKYTRAKELYVEDILKRTNKNKKDVIRTIIVDLGGVYFEAGTRIASKKYINL